MTERIHLNTARKAGEMTINDEGKATGFKDPDVVYIGREIGPKSGARFWYDRFAPFFAESLFHNPFTVEKYGREEAVRLYRKYLLKKRPDLRARLGELEGKTLACWCPLDQRCHGDVLIELVETLGVEPGELVEEEDEA